MTIIGVLRNSTRNLEPLGLRTVLGLGSLSYCRFRYLSEVAKKYNIASEKKWSEVIGLEIHAQISSNSKLFSGAGAKFVAPINDQVAFLDAALPGTLPVLNRRCVEAGVLTALALNCKINLVSKFDRKHYFYADLPAGYQITQQRQPLAKDGVLSYVVLGSRKVRKPVWREASITQLQLEQDSGKSLHDPDENHSLIDLNRAGVGLIEIVTAPDFRSSQEAAAFVRELQMILKTIGTCDGIMAEGSMRVDASVSIHHPGEPLGTRSEVKNLNSIRFVAKAIDYEVQRQIEILEGGGEVENDTRTFDSETGVTIAMRDKEKVHDYRFLAEPNLPPLRLTTNALVSEVSDPTQVVNVDVLRDSLPELPAQTRTRLQEQYGLTLEQSMLMVNEDGMTNYYEEVMKDSKRNAKSAVNFLQNDFLGVLRKENLGFLDCPISPIQCGEVVDMLKSDVISSPVAKTVLEHLVTESGKSAKALVDELDLTQITDPQVLRSVCQHVINQNPKAVSDYRRGKKKVFKYFIGQVLQETNGKADPRLTVQLLQEELT